MIYTVTLNPCIDYYMNVDGFLYGEVNKSKKEEIYPGGKGINVSIVLGNLGVKSVAFGFLAGFTGKEIERILKQYGCDADFTWLKEGCSRINVKMSGEVETEVNAIGPVIQEAEFREFLGKMDRLQEGDTLVLSGSIPAALGSDVYERIVRHLETKKVMLVVDTTKDALRNTLKYHPFLIKPNHIELGELFLNQELKKIKIETVEEVIFYAKQLQNEGARNVLVSMGKSGAVFVGEQGEVYQLLPPRGQVINSVGAGDSMVAGFLAEYEKTKDYYKAFEMGICTGSASAFTRWLCTKEQAFALRESL